MVINDPIGDLLARIRNAQMRKRNEVVAAIADVHFGTTPQEISSPHQDIPHPHKSIPHPNTNSAGIC